MSVGAKVGVDRAAERAIALFPFVREPITEERLAELHRLMDSELFAHESKARPGYCERAGGCVCGGDLPRVREGCSNWIKG